LLLVSAAAFAATPPERDPQLRSDAPRVYIEPHNSTVAPDTVLRMTPEFQNASYMQLHMWHTEGDFPTQNSSGGYTVVPDNGAVSRDDWGVGFAMYDTYGGGCVPAGGPYADPNTGCLMEPGSDGKPVAIYKERERWTFQHKYVDTGTKIETELPGSLYSFSYTEHTTVYNLQCFNVFPCDSFGIPLNPLPGITVAGTKLACPLKSGPGYVSTIFYQYSRYKSGNVPAGAAEWEPATVLELNGKAATYGKAIVTRHWRLAYDCGAIPNLSFNINIEYVPGTAGHGHFVSNDRSPGFDQFGNIAPSYSGTTGALNSTAPGAWQSSEITAGAYAGDFTVKATTTDPRVTNGAAVRTATGAVLFGFNGLSIFQIDEPDLMTYVQLTGDRNGPLCGYMKEDPDCEDTATSTCARIQICDNHLAVSHYGTRQLKDFIVGFASEYYLKAAKAGMPVGALGINDMSLPRGGRFDLRGNWKLGTHGTHRIGVDVDVDTRLLKADGTYAVVNRDLLEAAVTSLGGTRMPEGPIHFRMRASDIDNLLRPLTN